MKEAVFQANLIKELERLFPGSIVYKMDASYIQGFPDLLILYKNKWAALECKASATARVRPNQLYYLDKLNGMSYAAIIYPVNKEEVLRDIQRAFES